MSALADDVAARTRQEIAKMIARMITEMDGPGLLYHFSYPHAPADTTRIEITRTQSCLEMQFVVIHNIRDTPELRAAIETELAKLHCTIRASYATTRLRSETNILALILA